MFNTFKEKYAYAIGYLKGVRDGQDISPDRSYSLDTVINALPFKSEAVRNQIKQDLKHQRYTRAVTRLQFAVA